MMSPVFFKRLYRLLISYLIIASIALVSGPSFLNLKEDKLILGIFLSSLPITMVLALISKFLARKAPVSEVKVESTPNAFPTLTFALNVVGGIASLVIGIAFILVLVGFASGVGGGGLVGAFLFASVMFYTLPIIAIYLLVSAILSYFSKRKYRTSTLNHKQE